MAVAEEPFNLVPSCSHHFYLGFFFLRMGSSEKKKKKIGCFYPCSKRQREESVCAASGR